MHTPVSAIAKVKPCLKGFGDFLYVWFPERWLQQDPFLFYVYKIVMV